jgi:hypothetical protein
MTDEQNDRLKAELAAAEARESRLREALKTLRDYMADRMRGDSRDRDMLKHLDAALASQPSPLVVQP